VHYTIRVIARSLITRTINVSAESEEEALAKAERRISPNLKQQGYEFELDVLEAKDPARLAAA
jgi:hypothetical protein